MKRIARTLVIAALSSAAPVAMAADTPYPSSVQQEIPLSTEFPNMETYKREHRNDPGQASKTPASPYSVSNETPLSSEFPNTETYKREHRNDPGQALTTPTYPYSVPAQES